MLPSTPPPASNHPRSGVYPDSPEEFDLSRLAPIFPNLCYVNAPTAWPEARPRRGRGDRGGGVPRHPAFPRLKVLDVAPSSAPSGGVLGRLAPNLEILETGPPHWSGLAPVLEGLNKLTALLFQGYGAI